MVRAFAIMLGAMLPLGWGAEVVPAPPGPVRPGKPAETAGEIEAAMRKLRVAPGFKLELFASEPMIQNPVSFAFDEAGRAFVVETHRRRTSVFDIRNHPEWLDDDFSFRTVLDRSNFFRKVLTPENKALSPKIVQDRNGDGVFDARDLEVESERVRMLVDQNGDRVADRATTFAEGFNTLVSGVAAGVLARKGDVYFTSIPDLWRLRDRDQDGVAESRQRLATGFGVHIAFGGHDLHGLQIGPDGRLYFSIADRGLDVETEGRRLSNPDSGAILRCNLDGSGLEIYATGFRNPQELVFDHQGNLWTVDNNGDGGDRARLIYVVEGGDYGWRIAWQHQPNMGMWNYERLWEMAPTNTSAHVLPPVAHISHGPAGLAFNPGTGMPLSYRNHFFLADFPGGVLTFSVAPQGASFAAGPVRELIDQMWPVDVGFGPEPGLYVLDWVEGWEKTGKGRLYRIFDPVAAADPLAAQAKRYLAEGFDQRSAPELAGMLAHADYRVRLEAQFALASRGVAATNVLVPAALPGGQVLPFEPARLHAIWALGQIARGAPEVAQYLLPVADSSSDPDGIEPRVQALKILGELKWPLAYQALYRAAGDGQPRVRYFGLIGLGKMGNPDSIEPILQTLRASGESDAHLRHAAVMALTWINDIDQLEVAAKDSAAAVRLGALLAMRRLGRPEVAMFLYDAKPIVALEATRAIYDEPITNAFGQLAGRITQPTLPRAAMKRVLHANHRLGNLANALALTEFAATTNFIPELRVEALDLLSRWGDPIGRDWLLGDWRPSPAREARAAGIALRSELSRLVGAGPAEVRIAAAQAAARLQIDSVGQDLFNILSRNYEPEKVRHQALETLGALRHARLREALKLALEDKDPVLRKLAANLQSRLQPADATNTHLRQLQNGTVPEKQAALDQLAKVQNPAVDAVLLMWLDRVSTGKAPPEMHLEILEAARQRTDSLVQSALHRFEQSRQNAGSTNATTAPYAETLVGGDAEAGRKIFFERTDVQCLRCHKVGGQGGELGPDLTGIGARATREDLLESIIAPNAKLTAGFENLLIKMQDGASYAGLLKGEEAESIILLSAEDGLLRIPKAEIEELDPGLSAMPADAAERLSRRDLRNLVEYLARQK